jgi:uncharacterized protein (TIGR01440 family)
MMSHTPAGGCGQRAPGATERTADAAFLEEVSARLREALEALLSVAAMRPGQILVVGGSTSEVVGRRIGTGGSLEVAGALLRPVFHLAGQAGLVVAVQGCEHINRALAVERATAERYTLDEVTVVPVAHAGGSLASFAYSMFADPVMVEAIQGHAGIDVGDTFIGMHLRPVVVPVRLAFDRIGEAHLTLARTRPKLVGGERAVYRRPVPA